MDEHPPEEQPEDQRHLGSSRLGDGCGFTIEEIEAAPEVELEEPGEEPDEDETQPLTVSPALRIFENLDRRLERENIIVHKVRGWRTRSTGGSLDPVGNLNHHTASPRKSGVAPCVGICTHGRGGADPLHGPLCNFLMGRPNKNDVIPVYFIAAGVANHAGTGGPLRGIPANNGNPRLFGIEVENDGIGEDWPRAQRQALQFLNAILLHRMGQPGDLALAHKEWTDRKIDPHGIEMDVFRSKVREIKRELRR